MQKSVSVTCHISDEQFGLPLNNNGRAFARPFLFVVDMLPPALPEADGTSVTDHQWCNHVQTVRTGHLDGIGTRGQFTHRSVQGQ